jgi:hypothetical protein
MFASALPERAMAAMGKIHRGRPLAIKTRRELLETIKPGMRRYLRPDTGDVPDEWTTAPPAPNPTMIPLISTAD